MAGTAIRRSFANTSRPIRVFMQDGANDLNIYGGDGGWPIRRWSGRFGSPVMSSTRLGRGRAQRQARHGGLSRRDALVVEGVAGACEGRGVEERHARRAAHSRRRMEVGERGHRFTEGPAVNAKGEVFFTDGANSKIHKIGLDGKVTEFIADTKRASGQAFGPDGRLYAVTGEKKIVAYDVEKPGSAGGHCRRR